MTAQELNQHLKHLRLSQTDLAAFLGVAARSVRRWQRTEQEIPEWVAATLRAWQQLHANNIPWGADLESIWYGDNDQIRRHQEHDKALAALLQRVKSRGGPAAPWRVNLRDHSATLGPMSVGFYMLASGSFSLANYRRADMSPDPCRDHSLIEDAVAAFAAAVSKAKSEQPDQRWDE
jgi:hypothetical protein